MQSKTSRIGLVAIAAVVAAVAFVALRPGDDEEAQPTAGAERGPADSSAAGRDAPRGEQPDAGGASGGAEESSAPDATEVEIRNGSVVGGTQQLEVERGELVRLVVRSDTPDEIHLHGYDVTKQVEPGAPARFSFMADLEGIFEVEAHDIGHAVIAELRVTPA